MSEGICAWFGFETDNLRDYINERTKQPKYYCNGDVQTIIVHYLQCVKLDEIKIDKPWNTSRLKRIRTWATPDRLRRVKITPENRIQSPRDIPSLSRDGRFSDIQNKKYQISDGIHRTNVAKEIGLDCILADVEEGIEVHKNDTHLYKKGW